jgi:hypothetical protein
VESAHGATGLSYGVAIHLNHETSKVETRNEHLTLLFSDDAKELVRVIARSGDRVHYFSERTHEKYERERFREQSSLQSIPSDSDFPATAWVRDLLDDDVKRVQLDPKNLMKPHPAESANETSISGASLPWQIEELRVSEPGRFRGTDHPALQDWRHEVSLGTLAASGILG